MNRTPLKLLFNHHRIKRCLLCWLIAVCGVVVISNGISHAADQPQWGERHTRNMVSDEVGLASTFDIKTGEHVKWSTALGTHSYTTPVIAQGRVFVGTNNRFPRDERHQGDRGILLCLDEDDGSLIWQLVVPKLAENKFLDWPEVGIASPPTVEGDRVYLATGRGEIICLDINGMADGNDGVFQDESRHMTPRGEPLIEVGANDADILWIYDMQAGVGVNLHDETHCSVLIHGRFLYACTSNGVDAKHKVVISPDAPSLIVLDKQDGRLLAKDAENIGPQIVHCTWSSPSIGRVGGRDLVFFAGGNGVVYAFEALTEPLNTPRVVTLKRVWKFDCDPEAPKENPGHYQGNRAEGPINITGMPVFVDGRVYVTPGGDLWHGKHEAWLKCIDASGAGDITGTGEIWSAPLSKHSMSTPSVKDGLVYVADCGRMVRCFDAKTGKLWWEADVEGDVWGSTFVADGKVFVGTRRGVFWVLAAGKEKKVIASIKLDSAMTVSPTAANGVLYVCSMQRLYAIEMDK